jgi:large subunit ribosomal protein L6
MSRIGKSPIELPKGVEVSVGKSNVVAVKGPKGALYQQIDADLILKQEDGVVVLERPTDQKRHRSVHGLYRSLLSNMVTGVSQGFLRELELYGVGYRANATGNLLELSLGYSHPIYFYIPDEIKLTVTSEKGQPPTIKLEGSDYQLMGQVAAKIRAFRKPEPYKGKGVRYKGEIIRRKAGKTSGKK